MRKIAATTMSIVLMLVAVVGMGSEPFYPKPITFLVMVVFAYLALIYFGASIRHLARLSPAIYASRQETRQYVQAEA